MGQYCYSWHRRYSIMQDLKQLLEVHLLHPQRPSATFDALLHTYPCRPFDSLQDMLAYRSPNKTKVCRLLDKEIFINNASSISEHPFRDSKFIVLEGAAEQNSMQIPQCLLVYIQLITNHLDRIVAYLDQYLQDQAQAPLPTKYIVYEDNNPFLQQFLLLTKVFDSKDAIRKYSNHLPTHHKLVFICDIQDFANLYKACMMTALRVPFGFVLLCTYGNKTELQQRYSENYECNITVFSSREALGNWLLCEISCERELKRIGVEEIGYICNVGVIDPLQNNYLTVDDVWQKAPLRQSLNQRWTEGNALLMLKEERLAELSLLIDPHKTSITFVAKDIIHNGLLEISDSKSNNLLVAVGPQAIEVLAALELSSHEEGNRQTITREILSEDADSQRTRKLERTVLKEVPVFKLFNCRQELIDLAGEMRHPLFGNILSYRHLNWREHAKIRKDFIIVGAKPDNMQDVAPNVVFVAEDQSTLSEMSIQPHSLIPYLRKQIQIQDSLKESQSILMRMGIFVLNHPNVELEYFDRKLVSDLRNSSNTLLVESDLSPNALTDKIRGHNRQINIVVWQMQQHNTKRNLETKLNTLGFRNIYYFQWTKGDSTFDDIFSLQYSLIQFLNEVHSTHNSKLESQSPTSVNIRVFGVIDSPILSMIEGGVDRRRVFKYSSGEDIGGIIQQFRHQNKEVLVVNFKEWTKDIEQSIQQLYISHLLSLEVILIHSNKTYILKTFKRSKSSYSFLPEQELVSKIATFTSIQEQLVYRANLVSEIQIDSLSLNSFRAGKESQAMDTERTDAYNDYAQTELLMQEKTITKPFPSCEKFLVEPEHQFDDYELGFSVPTLLKSADICKTKKVIHGKTKAKNEIKLPKKVSTRKSTNSLEKAKSKVKSSSVKSISDRQSGVRGSCLKSSLKSSLKSTLKSTLGSTARSYQKLDINKIRESSLTEYLGDVVDQGRKQEICALGVCIIYIISSVTITSLEKKLSQAGFWVVFLRPDPTEDILSFAQSTSPHEWIVVNLEEEQLYNKALLSRTPKIIVGCDLESTFLEIKKRVPTRADNFNIAAVRHLEDISTVYCDSMSRPLIKELQVRFSSIHFLNEDNAQSKSLQIKSVSKQYELSFCGANRQKETLMVTKDPEAMTESLSILRFAFGVLRPLDFLSRKLVIVLYESSLSSTISQCLSGMSHDLILSQFHPKDYDDIQRSLVSKNIAGVLLVPEGGIRKYEGKEQTNTSFISIESGVGAVGNLKQQVFKTLWILSHQLTTLPSTTFKPQFVFAKTGIEDLFEIEEEVENTLTSSKSDSNISRCSSERSFFRKSSKKSQFPIINKLKASAHKLIVLSPEAIIAQYSLHNVFGDARMDVGLVSYNGIADIGDTVKSHKPSQQYLLIFSNYHKLSQQLQDLISSNRVIVVVITNKASDYLLKSESNFIYIQAKGLVGVLQMVIAQMQRDTSPLNAVIDSQISELITPQIGNSTSPLAESLRVHLCYEDSDRLKAEYRSNEYYFVYSKKKRADLRILRRNVFVFRDITYLKYALFKIIKNYFLLKLRCRSQQSITLPQSSHHILFLTDYTPLKSNLVDTFIVAPNSRAHELSRFKNILIYQGKEERMIIENLLNFRKLSQDSERKIQEVDKVIIYYHSNLEDTSQAMRRLHRKVTLVRFKNVSEIPLEKNLKVSLLVCEVQDSPPLIDFVNRNSNFKLLLLNLSLKRSPLKQSLQVPILLSSESELVRYLAHEFKLPFMCVFLDRRYKHVKQPLSSLLTVPHSVELVSGVEMANKKWDTRWESYSTQVYVSDSDYSGRETSGMQWVKVGVQIEAKDLAIQIQKVAKESSK